MRAIRGWVILFALATPAVGCSQEPSGPQRITALPRDLNVAEQGLIEADNGFGLKLFRAVRERETGTKNMFISPLSVAMALGMAYNGAAGATQQAMQRALALEGLTVPEVNESYRSLIDLLRALDPGVEFRIANSIWYRQGLAVRQDFLDRNVHYFDAEVAALDFASPDAAPTINAWVDKQTNGKIDRIVDDPIDPSLVMFLINAIYFKGDWSVQFDKDATHDAPFNLADGSTKMVPTMLYTDAEEVQHYADDDVEVLDLPYGGKAYSMTIVMAAQGTDVAPLVSSLDDTTWNGWIEGLRPMESLVSMPKFSLEYELGLNEVLKALGMAVAFDPDSADFSGIYSGPQRLYISKVKHKAYVDVNEEGTEAAAVTSVEVGVTSAPMMISVDRPFLFAIRERFSGTVLFMGLVQDPS